ncbi:MAG: hypothetical protein U0573_13095 [Phycisphaerales bacterium]
MALTTFAQGNILVNGDFENMPNFGAGINRDPGYTLLTGTDIPNWTIVDGYGATVHNTVLYPTISGNFSINTDGEGYNGHNINMYQDFATSANQAYELKFDWKNWYEASTPLLRISVEDAATNSVVVEGYYGILAGLHSETLNFVGTGGALRVRISHSPESGYNDNTFIVDNFAVEAVPAPGAAGLLSLGALAAGRRRRR